MLRNVIHFQRYEMIVCRSLLASYCLLSLYFEKLSVPKKKNVSKHQNMPYNLYRKFFSLLDITKYGALCQSNFIRVMVAPNSDVTFHDIVPTFTP